MTRSRAILAPNNPLSFELNYEQSELRSALPLAPRSMGRGRSSSSAEIDDSFCYDSLSEPHLTRNKEIRKAHPTVRRPLLTQPRLAQLPPCLVPHASLTASTLQGCSTITSRRLDLRMMVLLARNCDAMDVAIRLLTSGRRQLTASVCFLPVYCRPCSWPRVCASSTIGPACTCWPRWPCKSAARTL